jgi:hypothetical protein
MDKLQRAGRDFLMRLVAKHGLAGAASVLPALANELDSLTADSGMDGTSPLRALAVPLVRQQRQPRRWQ